MPAELIAQHGAVSEPVARAMAEGVLRHSQAQLAAAVTGIAGPTGGSAHKPVGLVWFGFARRAEDGGIHVATEQRVWPGDRAAVRGQSALTAMPFGASSPARPSTHMLMPYFAMV